MRERVATTWIGLLICALACVVGVQATGAAGTPPKQEPVDQLYVQAAKRGTLKATKRSGAFRLVLRGTARHTKSVYCCIQAPSGKMLTRVHPIATRDFIRSWGGFGFKDDHPTAVLSLRHADPGADTVAVRLAHPRARNDGRRIAYRAHLVGSVGTNLDEFRSELDPRVPSRFGAASLHIDQESARVAGGCRPGTPCKNINGCEIVPFTRCPSANLRGADLSGADLTGADLTGADLTYVKLISAILIKAKLTGADLRFANLRFADLTGADLTGAMFCNTTMPNGSIKWGYCR